MVIPTDLIFASSSGLGALGFSLSSFLIQLGSFLIVFLILKRYAFKPIIKLLISLTYKLLNPLRGRTMLHYHQLVRKTT